MTLLARNGVPVARLGCDLYASDLNPIACILTWGALNIIGASPEQRAEIEQAQRAVAEAHVATFLGRKLSSKFQSEVGNDFSTRIQGARIRHHMGPASLKHLRLAPAKIKGRF